MEVKFKEVVTIIKRSLLEVIFPRDNKCLTCGKDGIEGICDECRKSIAYCKEDECSLGYYSGPLKKLILQLKCKGNYEAGDVLVNLLRDKLKNISAEYCITYIPISKASLKNRGFNQCEYIANELGYSCNMKVINTLKRIKEVKIQKTLSKEERLENVKGAFAVIDKSLVEGKNIILIDDVITTGATVHEAQRVLEESNVGKIKILVLAKSHI